MHSFRDSARWVALVAALAPYQCKDQGGPADLALEAAVPDLTFTRERGADLRRRDLGRADGATLATPWVFLAGGRDGWVDGNDLAVEGTGHVQVTGATEGEVPFGPVLHKRAGPFAARLSPTGVVDSVKSLAVDPGGAGYSVAIDSAGRVLVAGCFGGVKTFGTKTLTSKGNLDAFVAWLDTKGNVLHAVSLGGRGWDGAEAIAVDSSGNSYLVGTFDGPADIGGTTLVPAGKCDSFFAKLDPQGNVLWAVRGGGEATDAAADFAAVDQTGNLYTAVTFWAPASFGSIAVEPKSANDSVVLKLDPSGKFLWASQISGQKVWTRALALDGAGNPHITGTFVGAAQIGKKTVDVLTVSPYFDTFVAKLNASGAVQWAVAVADAEAYSIAVDVAGQSYITGAFNSYATFGPHWVTGVGKYDVFVAKLGPNRNWLGAVSAGGKLNDQGRAIELDGTGNIHVAGAAHSDSRGSYRVNQGTVTFGKQTIQVDGAQHMFVWKIPAGQL